MTREEAKKYLIYPPSTSTSINSETAKQIEAYNIAIEALSAEPKWDCTANFIAEQLEKFNKMPQGEKIAFIKRFFGIVDKESKVDNAENPKCDLISRAEAVKVIKEFRQSLPCADVSDENFGHDVGMISGISYVERHIIPSLPSVDRSTGDLISRQWLLEVYGDYIGDNGDPKYHVPLEVVRQNIIDAPSADAVQGWRIGKPTEQGKYMVTIDSFGYKHIDLFYYGKPLMPNRKVRGNCWYRSDDEWGDVVYDDTDILAWQPLPKPYREDGEE